jgi:transposase
MEDKVMTNKRDYTGKTVYMGIDVHKKTYCCVSVCEGEVIKRDTTPSKPEGLLAYIHKFFPGATIKTAYEAGFSGFHLHRYLIDNGIHNIVVHPASIEVSARDRVKTDKRDALKIAVQLSTHRLKGIFVPSLERESRRSISRLRTNFQRLRQQVGGQFKSLLFTQELIKGNDDTRVSQKWIREKLSDIEKGNYPKDFFYSARRYAKEWEDLSEKLKEICGELKTQAEGEKSIQTIYESVPGIGLIHARELANELGDMRQFRNEKKLFSYTGLTPSEHSSGEHVRQGHISRQGRAVLRKILVEASWVAINKDPSLREIYNRLSHRGGKRAIVGIARRLIGRIRSCLLNGTLYEIKSKEEDIIVQEMICATS